MNTTSADASVKSAKRVLDILEFFAARKSPATLAVLAESMALPKTSAFALLRTLEAAGYMYFVRDDLGWYPTSRWADHALKVAEHDPVVPAIHPTLRWLCDESGETAVLGTLAGDQVLYLDAVEPDLTIRFVAEVGQRKPVYGSSSGRGMLSLMAPEERRKMLDRVNLIRHTPLTITELPEIEAEIERGAARGWHTAFGEFQGGSLSVSVPIQIGRQPYALIIGAPLERARAKVDELGDLLVKAAQSITGAKALRA
ncbi:MAG: IclR family transcriptional regulator [Burkholderiaceae bacterium]